MDLKQLEYIVEIAKESNITHAAQNIFISQSALNQQLLKLEKELGAKLFYRTRKNWQLTEIGKIYVENAKKILNIKKETYKEIEDYLEEKKGKLIVGIPRGRWMELFTYIFYKMRETYPHIKIIPIELNVQEQQEKLATDEIDMGIMTLRKEQRTDDKYIKLCEEEMVLILPKNHKLNNEFSKEKKIDISILKDEDFVLMNNSSTNREITDEIFKNCNIVPNVLFETSSVNSLVATVASGLCCGIVPFYYAHKYSNEVNFFKIKNNPSWDITISYSKESYFSKPMKSFILFAREFFDIKN